MNGQGEFDRVMAGLKSRQHNTFCESDVIFFVYLNQNQNFFWEDPIVTDARKQITRKISIPDGISRREVVRTE